MILGQHHRDPHDSERDGAEHIAPQIETLQARVKGLFTQYGPMTDEEVLDRYNAQFDAIPINTLVPRRYELVQAGWLEKSGDRRPGKSGVKRIVWQVAGPSGQRELWS